MAFIEETESKDQKYTWYSRGRIFRRWRQHRFEDEKDMSGDI